MNYIFLGATNYSKDLLLFLIQNNFIPKAIFYIPQNYTITINKIKQKKNNSNYADLKQVGIDYNIPTYEVDSLDNRKLKDYEKIIYKLNLDLILVLGWYYMIPTGIRNLAKYGAWGIHASLLPKYAGNAPLVWAIIHGEKKTGVTLFKMDNGVDDGDIIRQIHFFIKNTDSIKEVYSKATEKSKEILKEVFNNFENLTFNAQDKVKIEVYPARNPEDGEINWNDSSVNIYNFIRAQSLPYPCAFSYIKNKKIKIIDSRIVDKDSSQHIAGEIIIKEKKVLVATNDNFLELGYISDEIKRYKFKDYILINNLLKEIFHSK